MANLWLRLWHDMPTDPKWRTIARVSGQRISDVIAVYLHLLVDASRNVTRGHVTVTAEDIASAIDVTEDVVTSILEAMQGRVIDGAVLTGWSARQPKREDAGDSESGTKSAVQRKREQRAREKEALENDGRSLVTKKSRKVTLDKDTEERKKGLTEPPIDGSVPPAAPPQSSQGKRIEEGWKLPKAWGEWALSELPGLTADDVRREAEKFYDHWHAKPGKDGRKTDWAATWRNWIRSGFVKPSGTAPAGKSATWYLSSSGIEAKAVELGVAQQVGEVFPNFKARVYAAAGVTDDMVRKATNDGEHHG